MALKYRDRVQETTTTTGAGSLTLGGAVIGYQSFNSALSNGDICYYAISDPTNNAWEVGLGTFTSPSTLARTTILASSNSGSVVALASGTKQVFLTVPAANIVPTVGQFTANHTITTSDSILECDASGGYFTLTLPDAALYTGVTWVIIKTDSSDNYITVNTVSSQTINGMNPMYVGIPNVTYKLTSDGTNWRLT
jgi:hypothetical protein